MPRRNEFNQLVGDPVPSWTTRRHPPHTVIQGQFCRLEPIDAKSHGPELFAALSTAPDVRDWTYLVNEPFESEAACIAYLESMQISIDPLFFAIVDNKTRRAAGYLSLMRIDPVHGVIEVGNVYYSPLLQRTPAATEAQYLLMQLAFDTLGYRRFEWKCDSLNAPSRSAALRLGFTFEGIFRQAVIYKGRMRDTAWFSIINTEWPAVKAAMQTWLSSDNFQPDGTQRMSLAEIRTRRIPSLAVSQPTARG